MIELLKQLDLPYLLAIGFLIYFIFLRTIGGTIIVVLAGLFSKAAAGWAFLFVGVSAVVTYGVWTYAGGYFIYQLFTA